METKAHIRRKMLTLRDAIPAREREEKSAEIMSRVMGTACYKEADIVLTYISYRSEVDTESLIQNAFAEGKKVYCPKVEGEGMDFYEILSTKELEEGYRGIKEPQGKGDRLFLPEQSAGKKCLMILPGSAFDEEGNRIGYGKGYYDRYLERLDDRCQEGNGSGCQEKNSNGCKERNDCRFRERNTNGCKERNDGQCQGRNSNGYQESDDKGHPPIRTIGVCFACQLQKEIPADIYDKKVDMVITETDTLG